MNRCYWEVFGPIRAKLRSLQLKRAEVRKKMLAVTKQHGAKTFGVSEAFVSTFALLFGTPPDRRLWTLIKGAENYYKPRLSSKEGKALAKEMHDLEIEYPSGSTVNAAIGFKNWFTGDRWYSAGYTIIGKRVLVAAPECYRPPKNLTAHMKRLSDVAFERLTKRTTRPRKRSPAR